MSFFEKSKTFCRQKTIIWQHFPRLYSAFYFLDLEPGCQLIAVIGALVSLVKICWIYYLVYQSDIRSLFPEPKPVFFKFLKRRYYIGYHHTHYQFYESLNLITILNSLLLYFGVKWAYVFFLYYWIYISIFTWSMAHYNALFNNLNYSQIFLFTSPTFMFQYYLVVLVVSLIRKISEKSNSVAQEIEEPDLEDELELEQ